MTDRRTPSPNGDSLRAAEYVLGVLSAREREAFARRLDTEAELRGAVQYWEESLSSIADSVQPETPGAHILPRIEERLFGRETRPSFWNSLGFWRGLAATAMAATVAVALWSPLRDAPRTDEFMVAQVAGSQDVVRLAVHYDMATGELRLNRTAGTAQAGRAFELWLIAGQDAPVSLGVLPPDQSARIAVPETLRAKFVNAVLAISDEPAGGSPTGAPTGAVLATGQMTQI